MKHALRRLRTVAVALGACTLGLSLLSVPAAEAYSVRPLAPHSERAPESDQFSAEGVTTVGELRTVDGSLSYARGGRTQIIRHPGAAYVKVHFSSLRLADGDHVTVSSPDGEESYRYDRYLNRATGSDYTIDGQPGFWAMSVEGDTAVVTLQQQPPLPWQRRHHRPLLARLRPHGDHAAQLLHDVRLQHRRSP